jgi:hypothetical protein
MHTSTHIHTWMQHGSFMGYAHSYTCTHAHTHMDAYIHTCINAHSARSGTPFVHLKKLSFIYTYMHTHLFMHSVAYAVQRYAILL